MSKGMAQTFDDEFQQHFHATGVLDSTFWEGMESIPCPSISITAVSTQYEKFHMCDIYVEGGTSTSRSE